MTPINPYSYVTKKDTLKSMQWPVPEGYQQKKDDKVNN